LQASSAFASAGAASPDEFYDLYTMDLEAEGQWARARRRFMHHRLAVASLVILAAVFAAGFLSSYLAPYGYDEININALNSPPSWAHPFGTDQLGHDYLSQTLLGVRTEAEVALVVGFFGSLIGMLVGAVAGYAGGLTDAVVMRFADLLLTVPPLVTVLVTAAFLQTDTLFEVCVLFGAVLWMPVARVVRSASLVVREQEYVQAARAMGASDARILRRHIFPNVVGTVAVAASVMAASAVILEMTLAYLGLAHAARFGGRTDTVLPSVGEVLRSASTEGLFHWWGIVFPAISIIFLIAPIYAVGDGVRDALDPTQRRYVSERELARRRKGPSRATRLVRKIPRPSISIRVRAPRPVLVVADALARRRAARTQRRLLVEAAVVVALIAVAAGIVYLREVNPVSSTWRLAATHVQNISRAAGAQTQVAAVADPTRAGTLFAVSNDTSLRTVRLYTSSDGGHTFKTTAGPPLGLDACARGEPSAAIDAQGRQLLAFTVSGGCQQYDQSPYVVAAVRDAPTGKWAVRRLGPKRPSDFWDDYPAIAAGRGGHVYVAWSRLLRWTKESIVVSSSADGGRTWSPPRVVDPRLASPHLAATTVAADGTLYVTGIDARFGVWVAQSRNAGKSFRTVRVAPLPFNISADCANASSHPTPFQGIRCLGPNPSVVTAGSRVFVTYGIGGPGQPQSVRVGVLDRSLHVVADRPVAPAGKPADRFWPASSVDPATGVLWICFYDTSGDPSRARAWYSCTSSRDGLRWTEPLRASPDAASPDVLWEDARVYSFGDIIGFGGTTGVVATHGRVHPFWIDSRDLGGRKQEVFGATLP